MPPPNSKAKNNGLKLAIAKDKPEVHMIENDGPLVDSPVAIDTSEESRLPVGGLPQDVRASHLV